MRSPNQAVPDPSNNRKLRRRSGLTNTVTVLTALLLSTTYRLSSKLRCVAQAYPQAASDSASNDSIPCPERCPTRNEPHSQSEGARIFYLVVVHNNRTLHDAVHLLRAIRDPRNIIAIHVDKKAQSLITESLLLKESKECACGSIIRLESIYDVKWGDWSMNLPTLWGLELAVNEYKGLWDFFINLSGDTLPVYSTDAMASILMELPYNFVTSSSCETGLQPTNIYTFPSFWHKRGHYTHSDTLVDPHFEYLDPEDGSWRKKTLQIHFGSQWMILGPSFSSWIVDGLHEPNSLVSQFRDYLIEYEFLMTDETFFSSLLVQVEAFRDSLPRTDSHGYLLWRNGTSSSILAVRYERMDEHVPSAFGYFPEEQRYNVPPGSDVEQPRPWGPYFLGVYDLANVRDSGALFVRKLSKLVDHNMVRIFPVNQKEEIPDISWPRHVEISEKPDWEKTKARLIAKRMEEELRAKEDAQETASHERVEEL